MTGKNNSSLLKRFKDDSEFALATEVALVSLANDKNKDTLSKMVSFLGFRQSILFFVAFGGKRVTIPTLKNFTKFIRIAKASLEVVKNGMLVKRAADNYNVPIQDLEKSCELLLSQLKMKREVIERFYSASAGVNSRDVEQDNQREEPKPERSAEEDYEGWEED